MRQRLRRLMIVLGGSRLRRCHSISSTRLLKLSRDPSKLSSARHREGICVTTPFESSHLRNDLPEPGSYRLPVRSAWVTLATVVSILLYLSFIFLDPIRASPHGVIHLAGGARYIVPCGDAATQHRPGVAHLLM